jgi:hypothetical protein
MNWTGPPRNGEPQTGQSLGQKTTPNASPISYTLHAESTLRRYARLGFGISLASWRYFTAHAATGPLSIHSDRTPNTDGFMSNAPTGRFYDRWQQA